MNTASSTHLIEGYLHARQLRYFRGHHDDEYFFLVNAYHGRLHVHLQSRGAQVWITISAERYYPVQGRARVAELIEHWNQADTRVVATVVESSDPRLVGVVAQRHYRPEGDDFGTFADQAIQSAIDLFGRLQPLVVSSDDTRLLDAG